MRASVKPAMGVATLDTRGGVERQKSVPYTRAIHDHRPFGLPSEPGLVPATAPKTSSFGSSSAASTGAGDVSSAWSGLRPCCDGIAVAGACPGAGGQLEHGIAVSRTRYREHPVQSPGANTIGERVVRSLRPGCLDHILPAEPDAAAPASDSDPQVPGAAGAFGPTHKAPAEQGQQRRQQDQRHRHCAKRERQRGRARQEKGGQ